MISAGTTRGAASATLGRTVCPAATSASPNPACRTTPLPRDELIRQLPSPVATPFPNPVLATTPRTPFAPPVPLPYPGPAGRSKDPSCAMLAGLPFELACAGTPFGSPKPPVCTFCGAAAIVGVAELPVENTLVCTRRRGIAGALCGRLGLLGATSTLGAS